MPCEVTRRDYTEKPEVSVLGVTGADAPIQVE